MRVGTLHASDCLFDGNAAAGGAATGPAGRRGKGGAIYLMPGSIATLLGTTFTGNAAGDDAAIPGDDDDVYGTFE